MKRADILNARREEWDAWERNAGALRRARKVLMSIMEDEEVPARDRLRAVQMLEERGMGKVVEEREQAPIQVLQIIRSSEGGGFERLTPGRDWVATTVEEVRAELPEGGE